MTDVVGVSIELDLGDVEIGADQVALVVSKEAGRNSGVGDGDGDLRADRIINVQSQVSPDNARYSLISEMGLHGHTPATPDGCCEERLVMSSVTSAEVGNSQCPKMAVAR